MNNQHTHNFLTTAAQLSDALHMLDETHTAVIDHQIDTVNRGGRAELIGMLREIAYLAAETADELDQQTDEPALRLIKGSPRQAPSAGIPCRAAINAT